VAADIQKKLSALESIRIQPPLPMTFVRLPLTPVLKRVTSVPLRPFYEYGTFGSFWQKPKRHCNIPRKTLQSLTSF
jgi:hypothetical protein